MYVCVCIKQLQLKRRKHDFQREQGEVHRVERERGEGRDIRHSVLRTGSPVKKMQ